MTALEQADNEPITWLLRLEMARQRADAAGITAAQQQLARLGVRVTYGPPATPPVTGRPPTNRRAS